MGGLKLRKNRALVVGCFARAPKPGELKSLRAQGMDAAEVRLDLAGAFTPQAAAELARQFAGVPLIATLRDASEGGKWKGPPRARHSILKAAMQFAAAIDIELAASNMRAVAKTARALGKTVILSRHNFRGTDTEEKMHALAKRILTPKPGATATANSATILKLACRITTESDILTMQNFLTRWRGCPLAVIGMGESKNARKARLLLPQTGSALAYAAITKTAPGQLSLPETKAAASCYTAAPPVIPAPPRHSRAQPRHSRAGGKTAASPSGNP